MLKPLILFKSLVVAQVPGMVSNQGAKEDGSKKPEKISVAAIGVIPPPKA